MSHIGEFDLIGRISASFNSSDGVRPGPGVTGIGDDCAIIPQRSGMDTLVTTDLLIEDRHFLLSDVDPWQLGWKSAAVNISDIAAMGGCPTASFLSLALPPDGIDAGWVDRFIAGFRDMSAKFGVPLLGGDTSASPDKLFINVTVLGECPHGKALRRDSARPGDLVCVTGTLGDSAAGLKLVLERAAAGPAAPLCHSERSEESSPCQTLIRRHYCPMPRVPEGQALAVCHGVHAMMDISDGIASDLRHILKASSGPGDGNLGPVGAEIDLKKLPLSEVMKYVCALRGWDPAELAVSGGEDYELLFTLAPEAFDAAAAAVRKASGGSIGITAIGSIVGSAADGQEPLIRWLGGARNDYKGFTHF